MEIFTIGFTKKSAREFFGILKARGIRRLMDVRLHNASQLAGFTKKDDLAYFLEAICQCAYEHRPEFAPTAEMVSQMHGRKPDWKAFLSQYAALLEERDPAAGFAAGYFRTPTVLLCSEATAEKCHRRLAAECLAARFGLEVVHL